MLIPLKYILTFLAGGTAVTLVTYFSQKGLQSVAGILIFIPAVSLISYAFVGYLSGNDVLRDLVLRTYYGIPALLVFLFCLHFLLGRTHFTLALTLSMVAWAGAAWLTLVIEGKINA